MTFQKAGGDFWSYQQFMGYLFPHSSPALDVITSDFFFLGFTVQC